mmetsp:Transcript_18848/g.31440  ORF Transcript_18848/g.31440 Transcript_18848/m.31440 type:complete len:158 (+) Transcript_18848:380-853(+)
MMPGMGAGGSNLFIDTTLTDPRNSSNVGRASVLKLAAIKRKVMEKEKNYKGPLHILGYDFLAAAAEIFGSMAKELYALIKALVGRAATRCLIPESTLLPYWTKRLSMVIQRSMPTPACVVTIPCMIHLLTMPLTVFVMLLIRFVVMQQIRKAHCYIH